jgi:hypothetical protein
MRFHAGERHMKTRLMSWATALVLALALEGCASDCQRACQRERECFLSGLEVNACAQTCEARAERNQGYAERTHACAVCMEQRACSEFFNDCLFDCLGTTGGGR